MRRKHQFNGAWPIGHCLHCHQVTGLDTWQIKEMHPSMAECHASTAPRMGFWEYLTARVNCLSQYAGEEPDNTTESAPVCAPWVRDGFLC